jgi:hypothetical protein
MTKYIFDWIYKFNFFSFFPFETGTEVADLYIVLNLSGINNHLSQPSMHFLLIIMSSSHPS